MNIAIIPARGGSKRISRKNIREFVGKPIIAYSIEKAISSNLFDKVIVSTDDSEIKNISKKFGADVPFVRPDSLSDDFASTTSVIAHAIKWMKSQKWALDSICCIYPTSPLLDLDYLKKGYDIFYKSNWDYVFSATEYNYPVGRGFMSLDNNGLKMVFPENIDQRSQDLAPVFHDAGQFYWGTIKSWIEHKPIFSEKSFILIIPSHMVVDIDTEDDWCRAELTFKVLKGK